MNIKSFSKNVTYLLAWYLLLPPFQIVGRLTFWIPSLITRLIQKFVQNITSFVVAGLLYQYKVFKNDLNLAMFAQFFLNKTSRQTWGQKDQTTYNLE